MPLEDKPSMYEACRQLFENRIKCPLCGNDNWEEFLYVSAGDLTKAAGLIASCKHCGHPHKETIQKETTNAG